MMRVYLAGPMTGIPQFNIPAFDAAAGDLRARGYDVVSPAELDDPETRKAALASPDGAPGTGTSNGETWGDFLSRDVKLIADEGIEGIVVLPGWTASKGARLETFVGRLCKLPILHYGFHDPMLPVDAPLVQMAHGPVAGSTERFDPIVTDEVRVTDAKTGGQKGQKLAQFSSLDPRSLIEVAKVAGFGARKYAHLNYTKGFDWNLAYDALQRHVTLFWAGYENDGDELADDDPAKAECSGLPHMAHAAWQCLCLLTFSLRKRGTDNRLHQMEWMQEAGDAE